MKAKYLIFSVVMTTITLVSALVGSILYRVVTRTPWSFEAFTFSLVMAMIVLYFYNIAEKNDDDVDGDKCATTSIDVDAMVARFKDNLVGEHDSATANRMADNYGKYYRQGIEDVLKAIRG